MSIGDENQRRIDLVHVKEADQLTQGGEVATALLDLSPPKWSIRQYICHKAFVISMKNTFTRSEILF